MAERYNSRLSYAALGVAACALAASLVGCASVGDVAVRPCFSTYDKVAIWPRYLGRQTEGGLERVHEELFLPLYMQAFPGQAIVERRDLQTVLGEQDILPDRLDEESRARIRRILGVKGVVFPNYTAGTTCQLAVKVIDTETGEIAAALVVRGTVGRDGEMPTDCLIRRAIAQLHAAACRADAVHGP